MVKIKPTTSIAIAGAAIDVPRLGWGMWRLEGGGAHALELAHAALDAGMTFFDTADIYGFGGAGFGAAEAALGEAFALEPSLRGRVVLATKGGIDPGVPYNSSAAYLVRACEESLKRLRTDVIDLYQVHRPDLLAHPSEVASAFDRLHTEGKIRACGVSNYTAVQTRALIAHMSLPLASIQPEFSALAIDAMSDGVLDLAMEYQFATLAWSPLAQGRLARDAGDDSRLRRIHTVVDAIAERENVSRSAVLVAWVLAHPSQPIALIGSQSRERLADVATATRVSLSRADWYAILVASRGERMP